MRPTLPGSIALSTRLGREIPNAQILDVPPGHAERAKAQMRHHYAAISFERRPASGVYNCHGLTFANRRTGIHDDQAIADILNDDGYLEVPIGDVMPGDLALYCRGAEIEHSAVVLRVVRGVPEGTSLRRVDVLSKCGSAGEYVHVANEGPYRDCDIRYWSDRNAG